MSIRRMSSSMSDGVKGALHGLLIADALAMPTHWYYGGPRQVIACYGAPIHTYVKPSEKLAGSIMNKSATGGGGRGSFGGSVIGDVINHGKKHLWDPNESNHYHCTLKKGENTLEAQLVRLLVRTIAQNRKFDANTFRNEYVSFMTTPGTHNDAYASTCHRMFFANATRGVPLEDCPDNDNHNVDTIDGLALPTVVALASLRSMSRSESDQAVAQCVRVTRNSKPLEAAAVAWNGALRAVINDGMPMGEAVQRACSESREFKHVAAPAGAGKFEPIVS